MILRDYQRRAVDAIHRAFADHRSALLVCPTGAGKTCMFAHVIRDRLAGTGKRAMVLVHREELLWQNVATIEAVMGPGSVEVERAELRADSHPRLNGRAPVVVASKDSLHEERLARFDPSEFAVLVSDEAHHATADSFRRVHARFTDALHLGCTATPDRLDREALGQVYEVVAFHYEIADAIRDGWLVPVRARSPLITSFDVAGVRTRGGDLVQSELATVAEKERPCIEAAASALELDEGRRGLVFCVSIRHAMLMRDIFNDHRPGCARAVSMETPRQERADLIRAHRAGEFQFLTNVGICTEGYDDPGVSLIVVLRPTMSRALFAQMLGRGTRPLPGLLEDAADADERRARIASSAKPDLLVLNYTPNNCRHRLATPADVLGGKFTLDDIEEAGADAGEERDVLEALEAARKRREEGGSPAEKRAWFESRSRIVALVGQTIHEDDLFDAPFTPGRERAYLSGSAATPRQIECLERAGFRRDDCERMSRNEASRIISEMAARRLQGLCTFKQARLMRRLGVPDPERFSFAEASRIIDARLGGRKGALA